MANRRRPQALVDYRYLPRQGRQGAWLVSYGRKQQVRGLGLSRAIVVNASWPGVLARTLVVPQLYDDEQRKGDE